MLNFLKQSLVKWGFSCSVKVRALFEMSAFSELNSLGLFQVWGYLSLPSFHTVRSDKVPLWRCVGSASGLLKWKGLEEPWWKLVSYLSALYLPASWLSAKKLKLKPLSSYRVALKRRQKTLHGNRRHFRNEGFDHVFNSYIAIRTLWTEVVFLWEGRNGRTGRRPEQCSVWRPKSSPGYSINCLHYCKLEACVLHRALGLARDLERKNAKLWNTYPSSHPDPGL